MTFAVNVNGGTGAGSKRPLKLAAPWPCLCGVFQPSWRTRCDQCKETKP